MCKNMCINGRVAKRSVHAASKFNNACEEEESSCCRRNFYKLNALASRRRYGG